MSHAPSDVEICSNALLLIGHNAISSFTEGGAGAQVASNLYDQTLESLLSYHPWRFAVGQVALARLVDVPVNTWSYAFQLPTDFLRAIKVYPHGDYEIFEDMIYSNNDALDLDYLFRPEESRFPAYFTEALTYYLASKFSIPVTSNRALAETYNAKYMEALGQAMAADSQGRVPTAIVDSPFTDVRY